MELDVLVSVKVFPVAEAFPESVKSHSIVSGLENPLAVHVAGRLLMVMLVGPDMDAMITPP